MKKLKSKSGFTLAEMLMVIAIILILSGVSFIAVNSYQRSLGQVERDGIAKEIFVAAQNHLTAVYGAGYYGVESFGTVKDSAKGIYIVDNQDLSSNTIIGQMLPFGSIDDTVRVGGSYVILYQKDLGQVIDVFYCSNSGTPDVFNFSLKASNYELIKDLAGDDKKEARKTFAGGGNSILGWYGVTAATAVSIPRKTFKDPVIEVVNKEKLYVKVTDPNLSNLSGLGINESDLKLKVIVTGKDSKAQKAFDLKLSPIDTAHVKVHGLEYTVILDDLTVTGMHFGKITPDSGTFIPGEDIEIQAMSFSHTVFSNVGYSAKCVTNSLFDSINGTKNTAYIANIRHLENLDKLVSDHGLTLTKAEQTDNFGWKEFQDNIKTIETETVGSTDDGGRCIYSISDAATVAGYYKPIEPGYALSYDGKNHSISDVEVASIANAGLFGAITAVTEIKNLELIDFKITGTTTAGVLAGSMSGATVTNVLARNTDNSLATSCKINAPTAGGLVGEMSGGKLEYCAAAVIVDSNSVAGGLVGNAGGGTVNGCYSGGHTKDGTYDNWLTVPGHSYDVTGNTTAGGLVGTSAIAITNSYSTCSVSGGTAGGFAGNASGSIENCYSTGRVEKKASGSQFAFLGSGTASLTGNKYYSSVNEFTQTDPDTGKDVQVLMLPISSYNYATQKGNVTALDLDAASFNNFVVDWSDEDTTVAIPYDSTLVKYYNGKYCLKDINSLLTSTTVDGFVKSHYGDWPSEEVFFINPTSP